MSERKTLGQLLLFHDKNSRSIEKRAHVKYKQAKLYNEQHSAPVERVAGSTKKKYFVLKGAEKLC